MRKVAIVGIGQTPVREHWQSNLRDLAVSALRDAMDDAGVETLDGVTVGNMLSGALSDQEHLGSLIVDYAGLDGVEGMKIEAACGSGGAAVRMAVKAVASGLMDTVGVVAVEKLTEYSGNHSTAALATAADADYETNMGLSFVGINALLMRRYMHEYGYEKRDFAVFPVNAHANAVHNPHAMFHFQIDEKTYSASKPVADPVSLLDASPIADGAAAVIVVAEEDVEKYKGMPISILACEVGTDTLALDNRKNPLWLRGVERSVKKAYHVAGVTPKDISLFEAHDAFSIMTALSLEASGFAEAGEALRFAEKTGVGINGGLPLSTMGGLKGRGHPVGATGVYQVVEAITQLRGEAPSPIQIPRPRYAMTQNVGGSGATVITSILTCLNK
ncbi:MAG: thiolase domain-containing protein [Calditrichaeota bacterium]|nr:MAG: thiolase domain-containing protein [Calditrichota bacterium]